MVNYRPNGRRYLGRPFERELKLIINFYCCVYLIVYTIVSQMHGHTNVKLALPEITFKGL